jgi:hypothetical protein
MSSAFWKQVVAEGRRVPDDRPLDEMTADLTRMLGDPDPDVREAIAHPTLAAWIADGVYDDLLTGLGDGMCAGLDVGLGSTGDDRVLRRSGSARVLGHCIERDTAASLLDRDTILRWGDHLAGWLVRERDPREIGPTALLGTAVAHGAVALGALVRSPRLAKMELVVLLDVLADRVLGPGDALRTVDLDQLAAAGLAVIRRDLVPLELLEPWAARVATAAADQDGEMARNAQGFLRSLHLQLALGTPQPVVRSDLLLVLIDHLRATNAGLLGDD